MSKKSAMLISLITLLAVTGLYIGLPSHSDQPNNDNAPIDQTDQTDDTEKEDQSINEIDISGISYEGNGEYEVDSQNVSQSHRLEFVNQSTTVEHDIDGVEKTIERFGNTTLLNQQTQVGKRIQYSDGSITYTNDIIENQTGYSVEKKPLLGELSHKFAFVKSLFSDLEINSVQNIEQGYSLRMSSSGQLGNLSQEIPDVDNINDADAVVNITNNSVVRNVDLEITGESFLGLPRKSSYHYTVTHIGGITVDEPLWVSEAEKSVALISTKINTTNNWIVMDHERFSTVNSGDTLQILTANGDEITIEFSQNITPGDRVYIRPTTDGDWDLTYNIEPSRSGLVDLSESTEVIIRIVEEKEGNETNTLYSTNTLNENQG